MSTKTILSDTMALSSQRFQEIRNEYLALLGGVCVECGSTTDLQIHHIVNSGMGRGRGRDVRAKDWFKAYADNNLSLLCRVCHVKHHRD